MKHNLLKYNINRTEFLDSYNPMDLLKYMETNKIPMEEVSFAIGKFAMSTERVFSRIEGKVTEEIFIRPSDEIISKQRDSQEVCFIVASDDNDEYLRILEWIDNLFIPSNIDVTTLQITGVSSLASGYNEAMASSKAKYKIYIREGVRIINPYFLFNILDIFENRKDVSMVGFLGSRYIPSNGIMESGVCYGKMAICGENKTFVFGENPKNDIEVSFIHSSIVATDSDMYWNENIPCNDEFTCSIHAMEYKKNGLKVLVPSQEFPWILYDYGHDSFLHDDSNKVLMEKFIFDPNKKHILMCIGASSLVEMKNGGLDKLEDNLKIFDENADKVQLFICLFPDDTRQWMNVAPDIFPKIERLLAGRNLIEKLTDNESFNYFDAYYGDSSPNVLKMSDAKKPVMIRSIT
ncbi:MAG: glycosyltransferase family protein [Butyrivibrio sp.]|uniref:glycosyltransferase n=1 Tax=Butyrivibrio sp. TaxID=28121 RepID=UPI0025E629D1|nr:glycosyltransferase [Butyrivibrio sp.]MCR5773099.1 glycosyltransferase family protein [Butyrivibrio sp.]